MYYVLYIHFPIRERKFYAYTTHFEYYRKNIPEF